MLENRKKDNSVYLRESMFGWIISGPIKTTTADLEGNYFFVMLQRHRPLIHI